MPMLPMPNGLNGLQGYQQVRFNKITCSCGFVMEGQSQTARLEEEHREKDHRHGLLKLFLGDYPDPRRRARIRTGEIQPDQVEGYIFPFDDPISISQAKLERDFF